MVEEGKVEKSKLAFEILKKEAVKLLKSLRTAIISCRIYPQGSKMTEYAVNDAYFALIKNIELYGEISLIDGGKTLFLGNNRISVIDIGLDINTILKLFEQNRIESVTFNKNLEKDKLAEFLSIVTSLKYKDKIEEVTKDMIGIEVNRRIYISIDREETVITKRIDEILEKLTSGVGGISGEISEEKGLSLALEGILVSLREIYDNIDLLQDEKTKEEVQLAVAKKVSTLPPQIIREILEKELPPKLEEVNFKSLLLSVLTKNKIEEIFKEIINWYNEIIKKGDELKAIEELDKLREFIKKLLSSPAARSVSFEIYKQLLELQLIEEIPEWVEKEEKRKDKKSEFLMQVDEIINSEPQKLLEEDIRNSLPQMIKQLALAELDDLILSIIHKLLFNLEAPVPGIRLLAMQAVNNLIETLANCRKEDIIQYVVDYIKELIKKEKNIAVYTEMCKFFTYILKFFLLENKYTDVVDILTLFREEQISCNKEDEKGKYSTITKLFYNISEETKDILLADMRSGDESRLRGAFEVISKLDDAAANIIMETLLETKDERLLIILSSYIKEHLNLYRDKLLELLSYKSTTNVLINILDVLKYIDDAELLSRLKDLSSYPEAIVREKLLAFVKESNLSSRDKEEIILHLLDDKLPQIRNKAVKILPSVSIDNIDNIIDKLLSKIDKEDKDVQEQICITLGEMKVKKAIPYLKKISTGRKGLFSFSKYPKSVQLRAQWALRQIVS